MDYEGELAIVIKKRRHHVPRSGRASTCSAIPAPNDVTARDLNVRDGQDARQGRTVSLPGGAVHATDIDPNGSTRDLVNGERKQAPIPST